MTSPSSTEHSSHRSTWRNPTDYRHETTPRLNANVHHLIIPPVALAILIFFSLPSIYFLSVTTVFLPHNSSTKLSRKFRSFPANQTHCKFSLPQSLPNLQYCHSLPRFCCSSYSVSGLKFVTFSHSFLQKNP